MKNRSTIRNCKIAHTRYHPSLKIYDTVPRNNYFTTLYVRIFMSTYKSYTSYTSPRSFHYLLSVCPNRDSRHKQRTGLNKP